MPIPGVAAVTSSMGSAEPSAASGTMSVSDAFGWFWAL